MILTISAGLGLKEAIIQNLIKLESHIQISHINPSGDDQSIKISEDILDEIYSINTIQSIYPVIKKSTIISNDKHIEGIFLKGIKSNYKSTIIKEAIIEGAFFYESDNSQILISQEQAKKLKLKIGDSCVLYFLSKNNNIQKRKFIVQGIFHVDNEMFNELYAFTQYKTIQKINKWQDDRATNYEIMLHNNDKTNKIVQTINNILPYNLFAQSIESKFIGVFNWIKLFDKNIAFILIIMVMICIINMTNALLILILERMKMIGVLKSYGASNYSILKIFLYNSWKITLMGIIIGNIIGITLCIIQQETQIIQLDSKSYFVNYLPIFLNIKLVLIINIITFVITQISAIIPYYIMMTLSPSNILKIN